LERGDIETAKKGVFDEGEKLNPNFLNFK